MMNFKLTGVFTLALFSAMLFVNCNKKQQETPIDPNTGCTNCTPSTATKFHGFLKASSFTTTAANVTPTVVNRVSAFFSNDAISLPSVANSITVIAVYYNGDTLEFTGAPYYYTSTSNLVLSSQTWSVSGANGFPSFTFKNLKDIPAYDSLTLMPDTLMKSLGFSFILYGLRNASTATFLISDGLSSSPNILSKGLDIGTDTITFNASLLSVLSASTTGFMSLTIENSQPVKIEGKDFKFSKEISILKTLYIKN